MRRDFWKGIRHFRPEEFGPNPEVGNRINPHLVSRLEALREFVGKPIIIHEAFVPDSSRNHAPGSQHYLGNAADLHIEGLSLIEMYLVAERFNFTGVGLYGPDVWRNPGLHLDVRPLAEGQPGARWGCKMVEGKRVYVPLDENFIKHILEVQGER